MNETRRREKTVLEVQGIFKSYRGIPAVEDVSFRVAPGEVVGFLGPNGAGKSTTVKIITGLLRQDDGIVRSRDCAWPSPRPVIGKGTGSSAMFTADHSLQQL